MIPNFYPIPGIWELSFPSSLLLANKQIYAEARHIFYGNNTWIITLSMVMQPICNTLPPLAAIPYVRTALLRFHLVVGLHPIQVMQNFVSEACHILSRINGLRTVQVQRADTTFMFPDYATISNYIDRRPEMRHSMNERHWDLLESDQEIMFRLLQPLFGLPGTCRIERGNFCVNRQDLTRKRILEWAFSNCLDAVIALRPSLPEIR